MNWNRMRFLINRLPAAKFRVMKAKAFAARVTAPITGMPGGAGEVDPVSRGVEAVEKARAQYRALCDELTALREAAAPLIATLPSPLEQDAMRLRYLEGLSALEVSFRLNYSVQHIFRILARAEEKLS